MSDEIPIEELCDMVCQQKLKSKFKDYPEKFDYKKPLTVSFRPLLSEAFETIK